MTMEHMSLYGGAWATWLLSVMERFSPWSLLLLWIVWGPLTLVVAQRDGHLRTGSYGSIRRVGYLSDNEWLLGHWLIAPVLWAFAVYFGHAVPDTVNALGANGLLKHDLSIVTGSVWVRWVIPAAGALFGFLYAYVLPFRQKVFSEYKSWRALNTISKPTFLVTRFTVMLNYYMVITVTIDLAVVSLFSGAIFDGRNFMMLHPDGWDGDKGLVDLYMWIAVFVALELFYLIVIGYLDPTTFMQRQSSEPSSLFDGLSFGAIMWAASTLVLCVAPIMQTRPSIRAYKYTLLNMNVEDFAKRLEADHAPLAGQNFTPVSAATIVANSKEYRDAVRTFPEPTIEQFPQVPFLSGVVLLVRFMLERKAKRRKPPA